MQRVGRVCRSSSSCGVSWALVRESYRRNTSVVLAYPPTHSGGWWSKVSEEGGEERTHYFINLTFDFQYSKRQHNCCSLIYFRLRIQLLLKGLSFYEEYRTTKKSISCFFYRYGLTLSHLPYAITSCALFSQKGLQTRRNISHTPPAFFAAVPSQARSCRLGKGACA